MNYPIEFLNSPSRWSLDDERYTWLTEKDKEYLKSFPFDYGDILDAENHFSTPKQIQDLLMCTESDLDKYCQCLWRKSWNVIHNALYVAARNQAVDEVFLPYAKDGHSTAMTILTSQIMRLSREDDNNTLRIKIVNDLDDEED